MYVQSQLKSKDSRIPGFHFCLWRPALHFLLSPFRSCCLFSYHFHRFHLSCLTYTCIFIQNMLFPIYNWLGFLIQESKTPWWYLFLLFCEKSILYVSPNFPPVALTSGLSTWAQHPRPMFRGLSPQAYNLQGNYLPVCIPPRTWPNFTLPFSTWLPPELINLFCLLPFSIFPGLASHFMFINPLVVNTHLMLYLSCSFVLYHISLSWYNRTGFPSKTHLLYAVSPRFNKHMQNFLYFSSCSSHPIPMN